MIHVDFKGIPSWIPMTVDSSWKAEKINSFKETLKGPRGDFLDLEILTKGANASKKVFEKFKNKKHFVHVGIGGSSLGPKMLLESLKDSKIKSPSFTFIENIDPDHLSNQLHEISLKDSIIYIVSKSGNTAETLANFLILSEFLKKEGVSEESFKEHFVFCTNWEGGELFELSKTYGCEHLTVPQNVGGRFSVLTPVGLLPALFAGLNIDHILEGVKSFKEKYFSQLENSSNQLVNLGISLFQAFEEKGVNQTVLMPYSSKLKSFSEWFVQLWAESLGKKVPGFNPEKRVGLTPIAGIGPTDQHSQMQLFMEGPKDKFLLLLKLEKFHNDFDLKNLYGKKNLSLLAPHTLSNLMDAEFDGTHKALVEEEVAHSTLKISILNEEALGELIVTFECLTVLMAEFLGVNCFDQPGVEKGKIYAFDWLRQNRPKPSKGSIEGAQVSL